MMADPLTGDCESTRELLRRLLAGLVPHAERLGCAPALLDASRPLVADGAAGVHRELAARHGLPVLSWRCPGASPLPANDAIGQRVRARRAARSMTMRSLQDTSLNVDVVAEHDGPLGPLLRARRDRLCDAGLLEPGAASERVAIVRGVRTDEATAVRAATAR
jgi:hypothetical protein